MREGERGRRGSVLNDMKDCPTHKEEGRISPRRTTKSRLGRSTADQEKGYLKVTAKAMSVRMRSIEARSVDLVRMPLLISRRLREHSHWTSWPLDVKLRPSASASGLIPAFVVGVER